MAEQKQAEFDVPRIEDSLRLPPFGFSLVRLFLCHHAVNRNNVIGLICALQLRPSLHPLCSTTFPHVRNFPAVAFTSACLYISTSIFLLLSNYPNVNDRVGSVKFDTPVSSYSSNSLTSNTQFVISNIFEALCFPIVRTFSSKQRLVMIILFPKVR